jgi:hypothetical protein
MWQKMTSIESDENRRELIHQEYKYKYLQIHMADSLKNAQAIELSKQRRMKELAVERSHRNLIIALFMLIVDSFRRNLSFSNYQSKNRKGSFTQGD